jgi:hypothetical protein
MGEGSGIGGSIKTLLFITYRKNQVEVWRKPEWKMVFRLSNNFSMGVSNPASNFGGDLAQNNSGTNFKSFIIIK